MKTALPDSLMQFCRGPQQFLLIIAQTGPAPLFRMNDETFLVLTDPVSFHAVLNGAAEDFEKGAMIEIPRASWHEGIITIDGDGWSEQHDMLAPVFARRRMRQLEPFIAERVTKLIANWALLPAGEPVDILAAANGLAFDVVAFGLLGIADESAAKEMFDTLGVLDDTELVRLNYLLKRFGDQDAGGFGLSPHAQAIERMACLALAAADERLARPAQPDDLIGAIVADDRFAAYTPERKRRFLADQITTLLAAGYVTTGESIFWALYLLAQHPAAQSRARAEIIADAAKGKVPVDPPPFLSAAFNESQRLYPPVWFMGRVARRDVRIGPVDIAAGTRVICSPYVLHRMPNLWPDPDQYRPERFLPDAPHTVAPRSLIPFSTGRRSCLGRGLALMEMTAVACATLAHFELNLLSDEAPVLPATFSMHPRKRVLFHLKPLA